MKLNLQLDVFMVLIQVSMAVWQYVTVRKGQTVHLSCPITDAHKNNVEWKNPGGFVMFFSGQKALKDKRYSISKLSGSEFSISISNVTFEDGGIYVCYQYGHHTTETKVQVTVLGYPKMSVTKHEGKTLIKCTAEGNHPPPEISWKLDNGPEIHAQAVVNQKDKSYVSMDILKINPPTRRVTVKCLVRHPALHSQPLINFRKIGHDARAPFSTTSRPQTAEPPGSTEAPSTHSSSRTIVNLTPTHVRGTSSDNPIRLSTSQATAPTGFPLEADTSTLSPLSPTDNSAPSISTSGGNGTVKNTTSSTGWISGSNETEEVHTEGNRTVTLDNPKMQAGASGKPSLIVFLVASLVVCLLVVVIFFAIKLRRAHILWKRENEESDPSEESSKSKSSQEEKSVQQQRRRGLFNTAFTKYNDEPSTLPRKESVQGRNTEQTSQTQTQSSATCEIKETEL